LQNTGSTALSGPLTLSVTALQSHEMIPGKIAEQYMPQVVGAANGKSGVGATLDFSESLGDLGELPPQGVSNPVDLRLKLSNPNVTEPVITATVTGRRCP
jgi:hypothetical protein